MTNRVLRKRVYRYLDAQLCYGAFEAAGSLAGLSADAIADGMAAEFDDRTEGMLWEPGTTELAANDLLPHVEAWMKYNDVSA